MDLNTKILRFAYSYFFTDVCSVSDSELVKIHKQVSTVLSNPKKQDSILKENFCIWEPFENSTNLFYLVSTLYSETLEIK